MLRVGHGLTCCVGERAGAGVEKLEGVKKLLKEAAVHVLFEHVLRVTVCVREREEERKD